MCEANAYLVNNGEEELVMEAVALMEPEDGGSYKLVSMFGEQKSIKAGLVNMNLVDHRIVFKERPVE